MQRMEKRFGQCLEGWRINSSNLTRGAQEAHEGHNKK